MLGPLRVSRSVLVPERELRWRFSRSSGPGGQSVNTADSRVELSLDITTTTALGPVLRARALERRGFDQDLQIAGGDHTDNARPGRSHRPAPHEAIVEMLHAGVTNCETAWADRTSPPRRERGP